MTVTYAVDGDSDKLDLQTTWGVDDVNYIVDDAAEDFHAKHDGWESTWPLNFEIFIDDVSQGVYNVEREMTPTFSCTKV